VEGEMIKMVNFTEKERKFIQKAFRSTRKFFPDDPLNTAITEDNMNDIMLAVNYYHNHVGSIGRDGHETMWDIFAKLGFCKDGVTTFKEREQQINEKKEKEIKRRKKEQKQKAEELQKIIENAKEKLERVQKTDEEIEAEITEMELKAKQKLKEEMTRLRKKKLREAEQDHKKFLETIQKDYLAISEDIKDTETELEAYREQEKREKEKEQPKEEVKEIPPESEPTPPPEPIQEPEAAEKDEESSQKGTINPFAHMAHKQIKNDYTVDELKDVADELSVKYDSYILKDDLITKIREA
jgi:DNA repair exonuclease SbcCD ATPase subunit